MKTVIVCSIFIVVALIVFAAIIIRLRKSESNPKRFGTIVINTTDVQKDVVTIEFDKSITELMTEKDVIFHVVVEDEK